MKRFSVSALALAFALLLAACAKEPQVSTSGSDQPVQSASVSAPDAPAEPVESVRARLAELHAEWQNWPELAEREGYVLCSGRPVNQDGVERFLASYQAGEPASLTVLSYGSTIPMVYQIDFDGQGAMCATICKGEGQFEEAESAGVYSRATDYVFEGFGLVVPKEEEAERSELDAAPGEQLLADGISPERAVQIARQANERLYAYRSAGDGAGFGARGVVIPDSIPEDPGPRADGIALDYRPAGGERLGERPCYRVETYREGEGDAYYDVLLVDARDGSLVWTIEMVNGSAVPIYDADQTYITCPAA
ncbi:hypothetical protein [Ligaoa zhengdingensis]|uniref:hypothetical protein n=3 Tax=Ligaoa zhengdingensis TaxID=2763658 RepID=UPI0031B9DBA4